MASVFVGARAVTASAKPRRLGLTGVTAVVVEGGVQLVLDPAFATPNAVALLRTAARTHI